MGSGGWNDQPHPIYCSDRHSDLFLWSSITLAMRLKWKYKQITQTVFSKRNWLISSQPTKTKQCCQAAQQEAEKNARLWITRRAVQSMCRIHRLNSHRRPDIRGGKLPPLIRTKTRPARPEQIKTVCQAGQNWTDSNYANANNVFALPMAAL